MFFRISHFLLRTVDSDSYFTDDSKFQVSGMIPPCEPASSFWSLVMVRQPPQVSAGDYHSVLLRSDGMVVTCGDNSFGQCDISPPEPRKSYVCDPTFSSGDIIVHVQEVIEEKSAIILRCSRGLAGESLDVKLQRRHLVMNFRVAIANAFKVNVHRLRVVLPKGELQPSVEEVLVQLCRKSPQSIMCVSCQ